MHFSSQSSDTTTVNTIWCHLYGTDVKQDRFKLTVGDLDKIDVYDLKAMIIPHLASTAKQRPAFELRLYKVPTSAKDLPTFLDTVVAVEELIYPHEKVSKYLSREYLQEGLLHLVVIPVDSREQFLLDMAKHKKAKSNAKSFFTVVFLLCTLVYLYFTF